MVPDEIDARDTGAIIMLWLLFFSVTGGGWTAWRRQSRSPEMPREMGDLVLGTSERYAPRIQELA